MAKSKKVSKRSKTTSVEVSTTVDAQSLVNHAVSSVTMDYIKDKITPALQRKVVKLINEELKRIAPTMDKLLGQLVQKKVEEAFRAEIKQMKTKMKVVIDTDVNWY